MLPSSVLPTNTRVDPMVLPTYKLSLSLKREDTNPSGSHKDRAMVAWLNAYTSQGITKFAIASSGNAVISLLFYAQYLPISVHAFLSPALPEDKRTRLAVLLGIDSLSQNSTQTYALNESRITIEFTQKPVSGAFKYALESGAKLLSSAKDDIALTGYEKIAEELADQQYSDIFIPASSGATAVGIYRGYSRLQTIKLPKFHIVQTTHVNVLVRDFDSHFVQTETSLASAIVDRIGHRAPEIAEIIKRSNGNGWVINDVEITEGMRTLTQSGITHCSQEAGMLVGAVYKALENGAALPNPLLLISGTKQ